MTLRRIAELIPDEYRREILETNMIDTAVAQAGDGPMFYLSTIWKNYVEPDYTDDCNRCRARVLDNFKGLKNILIELEKASRLLNTA